MNKIKKFGFLSSLSCVAIIAMAGLGVNAVTSYTAPSTVITASAEETSDELQLGDNTVTPAPLHSYAMDINSSGYYQFDVSGTTNYFVTINYTDINGESVTTYIKDYIAGRDSSIVLEIRYNSVLEVIPAWQDETQIEGTSYTLSINKIAGTGEELTVRQDPYKVTSKNYDEGVDYTFTAPADGKYKIEVTNTSNHYVEINYTHATKGAKHAILCDSLTSTVLEIKGGTTATINVNWNDHFIVDDEAVANGYRISIVEAPNEIAPPPVDPEDPIDPPVVQKSFIQIIVDAIKAAFNLITILLNVVKTIATIIG